MKPTLFSAVTLITITLLVFSGHSHRCSSSTRSSESRYLRRLRKFNPPRHVDVGLRDFRLPQRKIYKKAGKLGDQGAAGSTTSSSSSHHRRHLAPKKQCRPATTTPKCHKMKKPKHCHKPKKVCKKKARCKKCIPKHKYYIPSSTSHSSSSSSRRSVSLDIMFSQEDAAILGSCDQPAVAVHHRHYSRRLRREERSRSRSRSRSINYPL